MAEGTRRRAGRARFLFFGVTISAVLVVLTALALYLFLNKFADDTTEAIFAERALPSVSTEAWAQVRVGMTKEQVKGLLGEAGSRGQVSVTIDGKEHKGPEYWEYGWTDGVTMFGGPSDKAYVVCFDQTDKVESFRAPLESPGVDEASPKGSSARAETPAEQR